jgi:hypothetical protein
MVLERKRQVVRLIGASGVFRFTPPLGFRARILAVNWQGTVGASPYDTCVLTASVGGDNFWAVSMYIYSNTPKGCFALGMTNAVPLSAFTNAFPVPSQFLDGAMTAGLPDFYWENQSVLVGCSCDVGTVTTSSLVYELIPV